MPSTYTANKVYELQATGENAGTWGTLLNAVLSIIDLNLGGRLALNVAGSSDVTLTTTQERNAYILMTGVLTGNISVVFTTTNGGFYLLDNRSTGAFTITAKYSGGTGVVIPQNSKALVMIDPDNTRAVMIGTPLQMTTTGDMIYQDANGAQRLAIGATANSVLRSTGSIPAWSVITPQVVVALSDGATPALNAALGNTFTLTTTTNPTIAVPSNATSGQRIIIAITASGGDRTAALNTGAGGFKYGSDITALTAIASGKTDYIGAIYSAATSLWNVVAYVKGY